MEKNKFFATKHQSNIILIFTLKNGVHSLIKYFHHEMVVFLQNPIELLPTV